MKPNSSIPRRTAFAIAAASAGLTLAVTATIASSFGLIVPATSAPAVRTGGELSTQEPLVPAVIDRLAAVPPGSVDQLTANGAASPPTGPVDARQARRERDDDNDNRRTGKVRRASPTGSSAERSARRVVSRDHEDHDDD
jgi:hypothetical protein